MHITTRCHASAVYAMAVPQFDLSVCLSVRACERSIRADQCSNLQWLTLSETRCPSVVFCHACSPLRSRSFDFCYQILTTSPSFILVLIELGTYRPSDQWRRKHFKSGGAQIPSPSAGKYFTVHHLPTFRGASRDRAL